MIAWCSFLFRGILWGEQGRIVLRSEVVCAALCGRAAFFIGTVPAVKGTVPDLLF
jgi:hypothetical protein